MDRETQKHLVSLAMKVLAATVGERYALADQFMDEVMLADAMDLAIMTWIDSTVSYMQWGDFGDTDDPLPIVFLSADDELLAVNDPQEVPPPLLWASRVFHARMIKDRDNFYALLAVIDSSEKLEWVDTLLQACALTCRRRRAESRQPGLN